MAELKKVNGDLIIKDTEKLLWNIQSLLMEIAENMKKEEKVSPIELPKEVEKVVDTNNTDYLPKEVKKVVDTSDTNDSISLSIPITVGEVSSSYFSEKKTTKKKKK